MRDTYLTVADVAEGYYTEKRSKFYAFVHHVESAEEVRTLQQQYKKKYYDARHVCYAYRLGAEGETFRANDDGEPSSTAGKPILGALMSADITNAVIFVIRYYGGVNLGTGGLIVAYREASQSAIENARTANLIEERQVEEQITYTFSYPQINAVMKIVKDMEPRIIAQDFQTTCSITLSIRRSLMPQLKARLETISFLQ
ncbi:MAG: YigZ family protein [Prevotella sp.]|nr:YigZ family protein [Prevotella sp.]